MYFKSDKQKQLDVQLHTAIAAGSQIEKAALLNAWGLVNCIAMKKKDVSGSY